MAFPVITNQANGQENSDVTSHVITIGTVDPGDLLLVLFTADENPTVTVESGTGWTLQSSGINNGSTVNLYLFAKIATGSDTLTLNTSTAQQSAHQLYKITNYNPEIAVYNTAYDLNTTSGTSANIDPYTTHTPSKGLQDYGCIVCFAADGTVVASAPPTDFSELITRQGIGINSVSLSCAIRYHRYSSYDVGTFTNSSAVFVSMIISIWPILGTLVSMYGGDSTKIGTGYRTIATIE